MVFEPLEVEIPEPAEPGSRFHRWLAMAVATVTLFGALVVLLKSQSSVTADRASRETQRSAAAGISANAAQEATYNYALGAWADARSFQRQQALDTEESRRNAGTQVGTTAAQEIPVWTAVAGTFTSLSPLLSNPDYTADADPTFPERFSADTSVDADTVDLRQKADADAASRYYNKAARFNGVITLLAVVLFLLGLSLTVPRRTRVVLLVPSAVIGLWCLTSTATTALTRVHRPSEKAIEEVAEADRLAARLDFAGAIDHYGKAIALQPHYALAYGRRAHAEFAYGAHVVPGQQFFSFTDPEAVKVGVRDAERAVALGAGNDIDTVNTLGALLFHAERFGEAETVFGHVVDLNEDNPLGWLNLASAQVAQGESDDAEDSFRAAIEKIDSRPDSSERRSLYGTVLGGLDEVAIRVPDQADLVAHFRDEIVDAELAKEVGQGPPAPPGTTATGTVTFSALSANATFTVSGSLDPETPLAVVWSTRAAPDQPFQAEPGMVTLERLGTPTGGRIVASGNPAQCAKPGEYRADLYLGGARVASTVASRPKASFGDAVYVVDNDLGAALCRPLDWKQENQPGQQVQLTSPDGDATLAVAAFAVPATAGFDTDTLAQLAVRAAGASGRVTTPVKTTVGTAPGYRATVTEPDGTSELVEAVALSPTDIRVVVAGGSGPGAGELNDVLATLFLYPGTT